MPKTRISKNNMAKKGSWAITILRIVLGIVFTYHGALKLFVTGGLPGTAKYFASLGIPSSNIFAVIVAYVEFLGGILLVIGLLTRWASVFILIDMLAAFFIAHWPKGFSIANGGYEFVLVLIAGLIVIFKNPSRLALANILKNKNLR